ncbi:MAG: hypothetical protein O3C27_04395 [Actinomycetota bacterium]|nr:hypothetical protein [Actinomycetota bacterium]
MLRLVPIEGSTLAETIEIELELSRPDARLTLGDIRRAAIAHADGELHEEAHRLWAALALAAASVDAPALEDLARQRVADCLASASLSPSLAPQVDQVAESFRRCNVRFDYLAIAKDRAGGRSAGETAALHGCSVSTVARALEFVAQRNELLARVEMSEVLSVESDPVLLAAEYGVDVPVMRWILAMRHDRRR